ncbi:isochorismatase [Pseudomonas agarici]|uniref:Isochorismatase n=1 Tax=Pseudomonas agarici TaxID=46677 RepID=A0A0X1T1G6_PSEAA|nr:cysteine hydrolase family protein [Pseudomonas agarici]AMB85915.1 isochorismatase [Pseudomonas agarici]NWB90680.1 cysteine hydrolase [Pseudomonas agarici]NWC07407.1 cysteine hydrolase [Pseudomonas agarici]SEK45502.1 Nicotinamidase-related amidase [Pseudomonas agarici]
MSHAPRRALIVIDVQNEYVSGNLLIEYPPIDASLANIGKAIDTANAVGIPVVVVQNDSPIDSPLFAIGSSGWALHPVVGSRAHDHLIHKTLPSAFADTDLGQWLAARNIDTLSVVGYMTHNCDASTIFEATHRGLAVEFLSDASGSLPYANAAGQASAEEIHRVFSVVFHTRFAAVVSTAQWQCAVNDGVALSRSSIPASNQQALHRS